MNQEGPRSDSTILKLKTSPRCNSWFGLQDIARVCLCARLCLHRVYGVYYTWLVRGKVSFTLFGATFILC